MSLVIENETIDYFELSRMIKGNSPTGEVENATIRWCMVNNTPNYAFKRRCNCEKRQQTTDIIVICPHPIMIFGSTTARNITIENCTFLPPMIEETDNLS